MPAIDERAFFGDAGRQKQIVADLGDSLLANPQGVYLLMGGPRSGKTRAVKKVQGTIGRQGYLLVDEAENIFADKYAPLRDAINELELFYGSLGQVYKKDDNYILFIEELGSSKNHTFMQGVDMIAKAHGKIREPFPLSIVIDQPLYGECPLPGLQQHTRKVEAERDRQELRRVCEANPDLKLFETRYDNRQTLAQLQKLERQASLNKRLKFLHYMGIDTEAHSWEQIMAAAQEAAAHSPDGPPDASTWAGKTSGTRRGRKR